MPYHITDYSYDKAKGLGVTIKPSSNPRKKIDVYKKDKKISTIGAIGYNDFPTYVKTKGIEFANQRQKLYKIRHEKDRNVKGSNGFFADRILW